MNTPNSAATNQRLPWYRRLFGGGAQTATVAKAPPTSPRVLYACKQCGFSAKLRGAVYDHIKSSHKDDLDRNGHITENPQSA